MEHEKSLMERIRKNFFRVLLFAYTPLIAGKTISIRCYECKRVWYELKGILPVNLVRVRLQRRISWKTSR